MCKIFLHGTLLVLLTSYVIYFEIIIGFYVRYFWVGFYVSCALHRVVVRRGRCSKLLFSKPGAMSSLFSFKIMNLSLIHI